VKVKTVAKALLPAPAYEGLRAGRRLLRWRWAWARGMTIDREGLLAGLIQIGVRQNDIVLVHSSLTSLGHVEGGAEAVIDALLDAVGPGGTLLMPAYSVAGDWMTYVRSDPLFDPRTSPSTFGKVTDVFWRRPGVLRSLHPTHSVAAYGPHASYLIQDHEKSQSPAGYTSPFRKLIELNGRILHLGSPFWSTSSFHVVEDVVPNFPRQVYLAEPICMRYLDPEGREHAVPVKVHDPALVPTRIDKVAAKELEIYNYCLQRGVLRTGHIGRATVHLIEAGPLEELMEELAVRGITIYV
jgi:aminoglycoside 3-N-acetyltransferase